MPGRRCGRLGLVQTCQVWYGLDWAQFLRIYNLKLFHISVPDDNTVSTLELIDEYISNLANAKNTVVGVIQNIFRTRSVFANDKFVK